MPEIKEPGAAGVRMTGGSQAGSAEERVSAPASTPLASVTAFPFITENPYQSVLYRELAGHGLQLVPTGHFKIGWLWRARRQVDVLHFHWPQNYYRWWRSGSSWSPLSWLKMGVFLFRLLASRVLGYTIVWTIHEVYPHERATAGLDRVGGTLLARFCDLLLVHDHGTAEQARGELGVDSGRLHVVPHGSFVDIYPDGRSRDVVRQEVEIPPEAFTFLCFGHLRAYKSLELLLEAFSLVVRPDVRLVIAGLPMDERSAVAVRAAAATDRRIRAILEFVPDSRVAELFAASDAAVLARGDGGTSGALVLALSMGLPVVVADLPDYADLTGDDTGWFFEPGDSASLSAALKAAAADPAGARRKGVLARTRAEGFSWAKIAERTGALVLAAADARRGRLSSSRLPDSARKS